MVEEVLSYRNYDIALRSWGRWEVIAPRREDLGTLTFAESKEEAMDFIDAWIEKHGS